MRRTLAAAGLCVVILHAETPATGKKLFEAHCAPCHGIDGSGGRGPNLAVQKLKRAGDDTAFAALIQEGIPGTAMDGAWQLSDSEVARIVAYVRSLGQTSSTLAPGDPVRGRALYDKLGCAGCHIVNGEGRGFGPELSSIGGARSLSYLKESIESPAATVPEGFVVITARTRDGIAIRGVRVNEDTFTIQIKDAANRYQSFRKAELTEFQLQKSESLMPSYRGKLSPAELQDLVAYLSGLR